MDTSLLIAGGTLIALLFITEMAFWRLFRSRAEAIMFPPDTDESMLRFFTIARMRVLIIVHAGVMAACIVVLLLFLW